MALTGKDVYVSCGAAGTTGLATNFKIGNKSNAIERKGLGNVSLTRLTGFEFYASVTGDVTETGSTVVSNLNSDTTFIVSANTISITGAKIESFKLECSQGEPLQYSVDFVGTGLGSPSITEADTVENLLIMSDAVVTINTKTGSIDTTSPSQISKFTLEGKRTITAQYGTELTPQSLSLGAWEYSLTVTIAPGSMTGIEFLSHLSAQGVVDQNEDCSFTATFTGPDAGTLTIAASGMTADDASLSADPDNPVDLTINFKASTVSIT